MILTWLLAVLVSTVLVYLWGIWTHKHFAKLNLPFDKPTAFVGSLGPFIFKKKSFGEVFIDIYNKHRGCDLVGYFRMRAPNLLVCDPELIKLVTVKDFDHFMDRNAPLGHKDDPLFGRFLFALKGEHWKFMRHTLSPAFTSSKMKSMFHLISECGENVRRYLAKQCQESGGLATIDMRDLFTRYGNDVIATSAFGIQCDSLQKPNNQFYQMGKKAVDFGGVRLLKLTGFRLFARLMRAFKIKLIPKDVHDFFLNIVTNSIAHRERNALVRPDMIHLLMQARKGTLKTENLDELEGEVQHSARNRYLSDLDITAQAFLFILGGLDTTSTQLCFITHLLATHPDKLTLVQDEIDNVLGGADGKITYEKLQQMKYTEMVINETLRLYPPAITIDRQCVKPYTFPATASSPELRIKKGDTITVPVIGIHRDPDFFEDPLEFRPERFSEENKHSIRPYTFLPFGAGPRVCIGTRFAMMQTKIALACILSRFDLKVVPKTANPVVLDKKSVFLSSETGFWLGLTPRTQL